MHTRTHAHAKPFLAMQQTLEIGTVSCKHHLDAEESAAQWSLISMQPGCLIVDDPCGSAWGQAVDGVKRAQQLVRAPEHLEYLQKHICSLSGCAVLPEHPSRAGDALA